MASVVKPRLTEAIIAFRSFPVWGSDETFTEEVLGVVAVTLTIVAFVDSTAFSLVVVTG